MKGYIGYLNQQEQYKKLSLVLIFIFALIRGVIAFNLELGTDEAYYWLYSQHLKLNYFDHPPMVAFWIRLSTANLQLQSIEGFVRLGSVVSSALASWFIYQTCSLLHSSKAGMFGVILYNTSFFASITAGLFIMPDAPLMFFYTLCLWLIAKISKNEDNWISWISFGIASGLCIMSKVYGVLPWIGLGIYILMEQRSWLKKPHIYLAISLSFLISLPILAWNLKYHFATHKFQSNRLSLEESHISILSLLSEIANQVIFNNPLNCLISFAGLIWFFRSKTLEIPALVVFNFIGLPLAFILLVISLNKGITLPHWSGPAYIALIPVASIYLAHFKARIPKVIYGSIATYFLFLVTWIVILFFDRSIISKQTVNSNDSAKPGTAAKPLNVFDGFLHMQLIAEPKNSWSKASKQFFDIYRDRANKGLMKPNSAVVCNRWWGAQVEYYFCFDKNIQMIGLGDMNSIHEYLWLNNLRKEKANLNAAYCIVPAEDNYDVRKNFSEYYSSVDSLTTIRVPGSPNPDIVFNVFTLHDLRKPIPFIK